jgi:hypothetical protein
MHEFVEDTQGNLRNDIQIIYHAVSSDEPPGKPMERLLRVPLTLALSHPDDADFSHLKVSEDYGNIPCFGWRTNHRIKGCFSYKRISHLFSR